MIKKIMNDKVENSIMLYEVIEAVNAQNILDMLFMSDNGFQTVSILIEDAAGNKINYLMRATKGYEIFGINKVLKSLDLGITIEFVTFEQYDLLIDYCMNILKSKEKVTA